MNDFLIAVGIVAAIGLVCGVILTLASKFFGVPNDETAEKIRAVLPGANCGGCGYSGCDGYAEAIAKGEAKPNLCSVGGADAAKAIGEILGTEVEVSAPQVSFVQCSGTCDVAKKRFEYTDISSCSAAMLLHGGNSACEFACLGFGDCAKACTFGALSIENGIASVCVDRCSGCGTCVATCPRSILTLIPADHTHGVACSSKEKGAAQRKVCTAGCIGCGKCEKVCPSHAITVTDNLARIDYSLCNNCGECARNCPVHCIR